MSHLVGLPALVVALALALSLADVATAPAAPTDSPLLVRSLSPGLGGDPAAEYVMAEMTVAGQQQLSGETLTLYGPTGAVTKSYPVPGDVANGQSQRTVLFATQQAAAQGGFPAPDFSLGDEGSLVPGGGAVCITGEYPADCATWGSFPAAAAAALPDPQMGNAEAIVTEALGRSIKQGCPTWLDRSDDGPGSGADFFDGNGLETLAGLAPPPPRNNAAAFGETPCVPETIFNQTPRQPTNQTAARFEYAEAVPEYGIAFECSFDGEPFHSCPVAGESIAGPLADGTYNFRVYAIGQGGADPTPARFEWEVDTVPPDTVIDAVPPNPSDGFSASFGFHSTEPNSSFACQLEQSTPQACGSGKTYFDLADGAHTFRVWATDNAGNQDPSPAVATFTVDTALGDHTPPDTTILTKPARVSQSSTASFTYRSSEPGSSFQCRLDEQAFRSCDPSGVTYARLLNGSHTFRVSATDRAGNTGPVPASYSWTVQSPLPKAEITRKPPGFQRLRGRAKLARVRFAFSSDEPGSSFRCRLDKQRFRPCRSPLELRAGPGRHRFEVFAIDSIGNEGTARARRIFRIGRSTAAGLFGGGAK